MASFEHQLICKIIEQMDMVTPQKFKFVPDTFYSQECREAYRFLLKHYRNPHTYGTVPSWQVFTSYFPAFPWCGTYDDLSTLCFTLQQHRLKSKLLDLSAKLARVSDADPTNGLNLLRESGVSLGGEFNVSRDLMMSDAYSKLYEYYTSAPSGAITGLPFPWDYLNEETQGMHPSNYVLIMGRPKNMKSWIAKVIACYLYHVCRKRVIYYSMELDEDIISKRCASIIAGVDYDKFKKRTLDPLIAERAFEVLKSLKEQEDAIQNTAKPCLLITRPQSSDDATVSALNAKITEFEPDIVIVDGLYLMTDERSGQRTADWKNIAHISQDLKRSALHFGIPVIGVTQQNRSKDKKETRVDLSDLAFSDALGQDTDLCMHTKANEAEQEVKLDFPGVRDAIVKPFVINAKPSIDFTFKRFHTESEEQEDDTEEQPKKYRKKQSEDIYPTVPSWK